MTNQPIRGSCLCDPRVRPVLHEYVAEKPPWYEILDGLPQFPGPPPGSADT